MSFFCPIHVLLVSKRKENNGRGKFQRGISLGGSLATKRIATSITKGVVRFAFYCLFSTSIPLFHLPFSLRPCLLAGRVTLVFYAIIVHVLNCISKNIEMT